MGRGAGVLRLWEGCHAGRGKHYYLLLYELNDMLGGVLHPINKKVAYLGLANLSKDGLNQSIEAGVAFSGAAAMRLRNWFMSLAVYFH